MQCTSVECVVITTRLEIVIFAGEMHALVTLLGKKLLTCTTKQLHSNYTEHLGNTLDFIFATVLNVKLTEERLCFPSQLKIKVPNSLSVNSF